jgi:hypothetical protein
MVALSPGHRLAKQHRLMLRQLAIRLSDKGQVHDGGSVHETRRWLAAEEARQSAEESRCLTGPFATARRLRKLRSALNVGKNLPRLLQETFTSGRQGQLLFAPIDSFVRSSSSKS